MLKLLPSLGVYERACNARVQSHTADKLNHRLYNVSSGRPTTNQDIVNAIKRVIPDFTAELPAGHMPSLPETLWYFDITRLCEDTGFEPEYDIEAGIADYISWLRAGNAE